MHSACKGTGFGPSRHLRPVLSTQVFYVVRLPVFLSKADSSKTFLLLGQYPSLP
jgi:hypothetical protein